MVVSKDGGSMAGVVEDGGQGSIGDNGIGHDKPILQYNLPVKYFINFNSSY